VKNRSVRGLSHSLIKYFNVSVDVDLIVDGDGDGDEAVNER
jgi:hypothetical protein